MFAGALVKKKREPVASELLADESCRKFKKQRKTLMSVMMRKLSHKNWKNNFSQISDFLIKK